MKSVFLRNIISFICIGYVLIQFAKGQCITPDGTLMYATEEISLKKNIHYSNQPDEMMHKLDVYIPKPLEQCQEYDIMFIIHGGGFAMGDKSQLQGWGYYFAGLGYYTVTINYRLYLGQENVIDDIFYNPVLLFGDANCEELSKISILDGLHNIDKAWYFAIQDATAALSFVKNDLSKKHKEIDDIFVLGQSAGAITSLGIGFANQKEFDSLSPLLHEYYGPIDTFCNDVALEKSEISGIISQSGGMINAEDFVSPDDTIPTLFFHGQMDDAVPLCFDRCYFSDRRITGPMALAELYNSIELPININENYWLEAGHDMNPYYSSIMKLLNIWLVNEEIRESCLKNIFSDIGEEITCEFIELNQRYAQIGKLLSDRSDEERQVNIAPNPSDVSVVVKYPKFGGDFVNYTLINSEGKVVQQSSFIFMDYNGIEVDVSNLEPGLYLLDLRRGDEFKHLRIVVI